MTVSVVCAFSPFHARKKPPLAFTSGRYDAKIQFFFESRHFRPLFKPSPTPTRLKRTRTTTLPMEEVSSHGDELDTSTRSGYILRFHRKFRPFRHRSRSSRTARGTATLSLAAVKPRTSSAGTPWSFFRRGRPRAERLGPRGPSPNLSYF